MNIKRAVISKTRVFIVDDHPLLRKGLTQLIHQEADLIVCGEAGDSKEAMELVERSNPEVAIIDLILKGADGLELIKNIRALLPKLPILVLSMHEETLYAERVLRAGAKGYLMKAEAPEKVLVALRRILADGIYLSERLTNSMLHKLVNSSSAEQAMSPIDSLTDRELEIFQLIGRGRGTRDIARDLHISVKTIESHRAHIKEKMNLKSGMELIQYSIQWAQERSSATL